MDVVQGCAGRRRLSAHLDQPAAARRHAVHRRSGRDRHDQRRTHLVLLVQPADGAALSRHDRQAVSLLDLRRTAGERRDRHRQPRQRRTDLVPRLDRRRRRRVRLHRARSAGSRTSSMAAASMRFDQRTGQTQNVAPEALRSGKYRILRTMPLLFHPADPKTLFFATNVLWKTTTGGQQLGDHQPRPVARAAGDARERRRLSHAGAGDDGAARRHLRGQPVAEGRQRHLGGHRRWARARDARRRQDVARTSRRRNCAPGTRCRRSTPATLDANTAYIVGERDPPRRHASAHLSDARRRRARGREIVNGVNRDGSGQRRPRRSAVSRGLLFAGTERAGVFLDR